jgi:hypothetical protein
MFPKEGKEFLRREDIPALRTAYAETIAGALRWELGDSHRAAKTVMRWTGTNERTVKNWLAGRNGPAGEHLLTLVRRSDAVAASFMDLAGRPLPVATWTLIAARDALDRLVRTSTFRQSGSASS